MRQRYDGRDGAHAPLLQCHLGADLLPHRLLGANPTPRRVLMGDPQLRIQQEMKIYKQARFVQLKRYGPLNIKGYQQLAKTSFSSLHISYRRYYMGTEKIKGNQLYAYGRLRNFSFVWIADKEDRIGKLHLSVRRKSDDIRWYV